MVGFQEEGAVAKKDGFPASHVKMIKKELNLVEEKMLLKGLNKDADQLVPPVKLTKGEREHELGNYSKRNGLP